MPFSPPEDWHEGSESAGRRDPYDIRIVVQPPGGLSTRAYARRDSQPAAQLPERLVASLEVVQLSRMTRKKESFPCYGMQWGSSLYLYPMEEDRI